MKIEIENKKWANDVETTSDKCLVTSVYACMYPNKNFDVVVNLTDRKTYCMHQESSLDYILFAYHLEQEDVETTVTLIAENDIEKELIKQQQFSYQEKEQIVYKFVPWEELNTAVKLGAWAADA